ncbi:MAG: hypothetical protein IKX45_00350 [Bacteroidales bacterium]|nr:hypothetical protein [Bacteroidales bacterium]
MNKANTINYTLFLTKKTGKLWILEDVTPFHKPFKTYYFQEMGHDLCKVTTSGTGNRVLDILAGGDTEMTIDLWISKERLNLPDLVEFELVTPYKLAAKYHVNNCPGCPQLLAWFNASIKEIFKDYPTFAYIKRIG